jgi:O-antigen/teichoic acid export membrane protein
LASRFYRALPEGAWFYSAIYCLNFPIYFVGGTLQTIFLAAGGLEAQYWVRVSTQVRYLLLLYLALLTGFTSVGTLVGIYFAFHTVSLGACFIVRRRVLSGDVEHTAPSLKPLARALPPLIAESIAARADVWAFTLYGTLSSVGQYSGLTALMLPVSLVSNAMLSTSMARLDWTSRSIVRRYVLRAGVLLIAMYAVVAVLSVLFGPWFLAVVLGKSFGAGAWMIGWVSAVVSLQAVSNQFHAAVQLSGRARAFLAIQSGDAILRMFTIFGCALIAGERGVLAGVILGYVAKIAVSAYALGIGSRPMTSLT